MWRESIVFSADSLKVHCDETYSFPPQLFKIELALVVQGVNFVRPVFDRPFPNTFSLFLKASLDTHNEISFTCKFNSFSYDWLCTRPPFDREA